MVVSTCALQTNGNVYLGIIFWQRYLGGFLLLASDSFNILFQPQDFN